MDYAIVFLVQLGLSVSELALVCLGLALIFGMMRVINLAHGEFMMVGAYSAIAANHLGLNLWLSMLVVAPLVTGCLGAAVERLIIRRLYGRVIDTMLATWGIGLILVGVVNVGFGSATAGVSAPLGSIAVGDYTISGYELAVALIAPALFIGVWFVLRFTRIGLLARGTMQNPDMASSLGVNAVKVYAIAFCVGSALSGVAGALLAPLTGVVPTMGAAYIASAFITVISGGASALTGTAIASALFGSVKTAATFGSNAAVGEVALFSVALIVLRVAPRGLTGRFLRGGV